MTTEDLGRWGIRLHAIAAMAANRVIGRDGRLPWHLPEDLRFFKEQTLGHPVLMGRRTWESLGKPLPRRRNLVLSRSLRDAPGAEVLADLAELPDLGVRGDVYVIGGAEIYRLLLPLCESLYLTRLAEDVPGDVFFPPFEHLFVWERILHAGDGFEIALYRSKRSASRTTHPA